MSTYRDMGALIIARRKDKALTQKALAKRLHLDSAVSVCRWEKGVAPLPAKLVRPLAQALDLPVTEILAHVSESVAENYLDLEKTFNATPASAAKHNGSLLVIDPAMKLAFEQLHEKYPMFPLKQFIHVALQRYLDEAQYGLDANLHPIGQPEPPYATGGPVHVGPATKSQSHFRAKKGK